MNSRHGRSGWATRSEARRDLGSLPARLRIGRPRRASEPTRRFPRGGLVGVGSNTLERQRRPAAIGVHRPRSGVVVGKAEHKSAVGGVDPQRIAAIAQTKTELTQRCGTCRKGPLKPKGILAKDNVAARRNHSPPLSTLTFESVSSRTIHPVRSTGAVPGLCNSNQSPESAAEAG